MAPFFSLFWDNILAFCIIIYNLSHTHNTQTDTHYSAGTAGTLGGRCTLPPPQDKQLGVKVSCWVNMTPSGASPQLT